MAQRTRLCVTFEMDHHHHHNDEEIYIENNDRRNSYATISNRTNSDQLCLQDADLQGNRRYSSELGRIQSTSILPKVSITRAKSDIILNSVGSISIHNDDGENNDNNSNDTIRDHLDDKKKFETKRTNATLKKLGKFPGYINVKPRLKHKEHDYQRITYVLNMKPTKCHICSDNIYFYCYECVQCKLAGHKKCLQNLYVTCPNKVMPPRLAVFGLEISDNNQISDVLHTCIMEIEKRPIHKLRGIYKIDADPTQIEKLCLSFEFGSHLIDLSQISPHDIAGIIKHYLLCISTPIFNKNLQKELITIGSEWPVRKIPYTQSGIAILVFELRRLVGCLTITYRNNLAYLIYHLKRIADRQHITEMTANSLAIIFSSIIFRDERYTIYF
ncbi:Rho GTPase-activating protein 45 [Cleaved into: Minor histocompatibility antigen HA-1] [Dermatophagoides pteronyssinus]|uniref:Rho GTPase-activating protein 45 [Cleaved into: Minor histocompatibility antigen HA-1] n=1 Tax=Dermatophagoides pteronyssinus TaxID=6956 RepID=A0ABQ8IXF2_DERPT|nr:Rho GTPase-activating protein 45 [Cleaved into: Minor histocompatibility antigen HA-1] [Dermatophagoides pteronyssinus]